MEKKKINKRILFIIIGLLLVGILTVVGTYAYFGWNSTAENKDATVSVTSVNGQGQCNKASDNQKILWPVSSRNNGRIVTVDTKQTLSEYAYITWTLTINSINTQNTETDGLKHQSFKYELVNTTTGESYGSGNFEGLDVGDTITFDSDDDLLSYNTNYTFTLYLWIDGTIGTNPSDMTDQTYQFSLVCDITGASEVNNNAPLEDFTYILGSNQTTITNLSADFYNQSSGTISEQSNVVLPASITIAQDEVLLVRYIGSDTELSVPKKFIVNGNEYKTVILSYVNDGNNLSTGVFYRNDDIEEVSFGNNLKYIALNSSGNGYDNYSMSNMFNSCTSLSSIDLSNIDLDDVTTYTNALNGVSTSTAITVFDCDQFALFRTMFGYNYANLTFENSDDSNFNCYQKVEYIQSSGTQYIDTDISVTSTLSFECKWLSTDTTNTNYGLNGAYYYSHVDGQKAYCFGRYKTKIYMGIGTTSDYENLSQANVIYITEGNNSSMITRNGTNNYQMSGQFLEPGLKFYLFAANNYNSDNPTRTISYYSKERIYYFKLWNNGTLVRNMIPCYRLSDSVVGMYDLVNNVFYTNSNTDTNAEPFTKGPDVNS